jgi:hypothetical protein
MKLCIERDIYFIPKFHILETGTVKLSIETGLIHVIVRSRARMGAPSRAHAGQLNPRRRHERRVAKASSSTPPPRGCKRGSLTSLKSP